MEQTVYHAFVYGAISSITVELVLIYNSMGPRGGLPAKYKTRSFWLIRSALALFSGVVATAYFSPQAPLLLYVHIGAATPVIITRAARPDDTPEEEKSTTSDK